MRTQNSVQSLEQIQRHKWWLVPAMILVILVAGSCNSLLVKAMNRYYLPPCAGCEPRYFQSPVLQTGFMFLGEAAFFVVYELDMHISTRYRKKPTGNLDFPTSCDSFVKAKAPIYVWFLPTLTAVICNVGFNSSLVFAHMSTLQFFCNFNIIMTALLSLLVIRLALRVYQWIGVITITAGLLISGANAFNSPPSNTNYPNSSWIGIITALTGVVSQSFQYVLEERILRKYSCSPIRGLGMVGIMGVFMTFSILLVMELALPSFESISETLYMVKQEPMLIGLLFGYMCSIGVYQAAGFTISKLCSGVLRTIVMSQRTIIFFVLELALGWNDFQFLALISVITLVLGVLTYTNAFESVPYCGNKIPLCWKKPLVCCNFLRNPDAPTPMPNELFPADITMDNHRHTTLKWASFEDPAVDDAALPPPTAVETVKKQTSRKLKLIDRELTSTTSIEITTHHPGEAYYGPAGSNGSCSVNQRDVDSIQRNA